MRTFTFKVTLQGTGKSQEEAWNDAVQAFSNDPGEPHEVHEEHLCEQCGADLTVEYSVERCYTNKDEGPNRSVGGHYTDEGVFENDHSCDLSDGRYDLLDGSDTCTSCGSVVG